MERPEDAPSEGLALPPKESSASKRFKAGGQTVHAANQSPLCPPARPDGSDGPGDTFRHTPQYGRSFLSWGKALAWKAEAERAWKAEAEARKAEAEARAIIQVRNARRATHASHAQSTL